MAGRVHGERGRHQPRRSGDVLGSDVVLRRGPDRHPAVGRHRHPVRRAGHGGQCLLERRPDHRRHYELRVQRLVGQQRQPGASQLRTGRHTVYREHRQSLAQHQYDPARRNAAEQLQLAVQRRPDQPEAGRGTQHHRGQGPVSRVLRRQVARVRLDR